MTPGTCHCIIYSACVGENIPICWQCWYDCWCDSISFSSAVLLVGDFNAPSARAAGQLFWCFSTELSKRGHRGSSVDSEVKSKWDHYWERMWFPKITVLRDALVRCMRWAKLLNNVYNDMFEDATSVSLLGTNNHEQVEVRLTTQQQTLPQTPAENWHEGIILLVWLCGWCNPTGDMIPPIPSTCCV